MEKVLNQEEIDAMVRAARGGSCDASVVEASVQPCNFRQAGIISKEQVRAISTLHESFARSLTHSLGAYLRVVFEVNLVSVEQLTYKEFIARLADIAYLASYHLAPVDATAALQLDLALAFPIIDLLLGGRGTPEPQLRDITEIEEQIMEGVVRIICRELETAWQPLGLSFAFDQRQQPTQMQRLMPPNEKTLSLSFEIRMPEARGTLNLVFPAVVSNAILRKLSRDGAYQKRRGSLQASEQIRKRLLTCPFALQFGLAKIPVRARELMAMRVGQILTLEHRLDTPATLVINGRSTFSATPASVSDWRAAQVVGRLAHFSEERRAQ